MAGTLEGGRRAAQTNKDKHGADFYSRIGAKGGRRKNGRKGFGSNHELASKAGRIGGTKSRRQSATSFLQTLQ